MMTYLNAVSLFKRVRRLFHRSGSSWKQNRFFPAKKEKPFSMPEDFSNSEAELLPENPFPEDMPLHEGNEALFLPENGENFSNPELPELELGNRMDGDFFPEFSGPAVNENGEDLSAVTEPLQEISRLLKENLPGQTV